MKKMGGATPNALLGLLSIHPMSGYDVRQLIPRSIGNFWNESYGQIYPALKQMSVAGMVSKKTERQKGRPDRHVYSLTEDGRAQLREWLEVPVEHEVRRNELLLKVFFGGQAGPGAIRRHVEASLEKNLAELKLYTAMEKQLRKEEAHDPQLPYWLMTLNAGRHLSSATVRWCRETLAELDRLDAAVLVKGTAVKKVAGKTKRRKS